MQNICNFFVWGPPRTMLEWGVPQFPRGIKGSLSLSQLRRSKLIGEMP